MLSIRHCLTYTRTIAVWRNVHLLVWALQKRKFARPASNCNVRVAIGVHCAADLKVSPWCHFGQAHEAKKYASCVPLSTVSCCNACDHMLGKLGDPDCNPEAQRTVHHHPIDQVRGTSSYRHSRPSPLGPASCLLGVRAAAGVLC